MPAAQAEEISFTMDDPQVIETPLLTSKVRNEKILAAFDKFKVKAALFVCGMRIDNDEGKALLRSWDEKGHMIANHSYSHLYYNSKKMSFEEYRNDVLKVEPLIKTLKNFSRLFRYPYLKEGNTQEKRDQMRDFLKQNSYQEGYVSIDASDWAIDARLIAKLEKNPKLELKPYRDFYLKHIWSRAQYYNELAKKVYGRQIRHTLLIHHSLLNALFFGDLMQMFKDHSWKLISASEAFKDDVFKLHPNIVPAGESIAWASAKESGKFESQLRYPAEDDSYEKEEMDRLGL